MLTNAEVKAAASVVDKVLHDILTGQDGQPRKREQVKLIAEMIQTATEACTEPTCAAEAIAVTFENLKTSNF